MGDSNEWISDWEQRGFGEYEMNRQKNAWMANGEGRLAVSPIVPVRIRT